MRTIRNNEIELVAGASLAEDLGYAAGWLAAEAVNTVKSTAESIANFSTCDFSQR